jgi:hypothetical protein
MGTAVVEERTSKAPPAPAPLSPPKVEAPAPVKRKPDLRGMNYEAGRQALSPRTAAKPPADPAKAKGLDDVAKPGLTAKDAPAKITLDTGVSGGLQKAWDASMPGGKSQEQGGVVTRGADGKLAWKAGVAGSSGSFRPNYGDVGKGEALVGSAHTHPYDASEGGMTDVPFSAGDLANLVYQDERIKMVQSGKGRFLVARTVTFDQQVTGKSEADKQTLSDSIKKTWNDTFAAAKGSFQKRCVAAVKAVCTAYGLLFYSGQDDTLERQDGEVPVAGGAGAK